MIDSKVYYFGTCMADITFAEAGVAGVRLLKKAGIKEIIFPKKQSCCGQPAFNSGYTNEAADVARHQIEAFSKENYPIIVPSGSCAGMMKVHYKDIFVGTDMEEEANKFSDRIYELTAYLSEKCDVQYEDKGEPIKITWHSSCHALREVDCIKSSKKILKQLKNVELIELEREDECCGFGGVFSIKMPDLSIAMVNEKIDDILSRNVERVISGDAACLLNINNAMQYRKISMKTQHIAEFLWERIHG